MGDTEHVKTKYPNIPDGFRNAILKERLARGMTQREVGEAIGLMYVTLSQFERGVRNISYDWAVKIRDFYGMDFDLPEPDASKREPIVRNRARRPLQTDSFLVVVDGEVLEVLTWRNLGPAKTGKKTKEQEDE